MKNGIKSLDLLYLILNERKYMYNRLLELLLIYRRSYNDYFELKTEKLQLQCLTDLLT